MEAVELNHITPKADPICPCCFGRLYREAQERCKSYSYIAVVSWRSGFPACFTLWTVRHDLHLGKDFLTKHESVLDFGCDVLLHLRKDKVPLTVAMEPFRYVDRPEATKVRFSNVKRSQCEEPPIKPPSFHLMVGEHQTPRGVDWDEQDMIKRTNRLEFIYLSAVMESKLWADAGKITIHLYNRTKLYEQWCHREKLLKSIQEKVNHLRSDEPT